MKNKILTLCLVVFLFLGSMVLDFLFQRNQYLRNSVNLITPFVIEFAAYLLLSILFFYLAWLILYRNPPSKGMAFVYVFLGAFLFFTFSIAGNLFWSHYDSFLSINSHSIYRDIISSRYGFSRIASFTIMVIGLLRLLPEKRLWPKKD